jgi:hypothetical protein
MSWNPKYTVGQCFNLETDFDDEFSEYPYKIIEVDTDYNVYILASIQFPHDNTLIDFKSMIGPRFDEDRTPIKCPTGNFRPRGGRKTRRRKHYSRRKRRSRRYI